MTSNYNAAQGGAGMAPVLKEADRTSAGLRSALFDELDGLRNGTSNATKANAVAKLCMTIVETVRVELDVAKYAEKNKGVPASTDLASPPQARAGLMNYNVKLVEPAAAVDWGVFRREGDAYLRRLGVSDDAAIWLAAKLFLLEWKKARTGRAWHPKRLRWESAARTYKLDTPKVFGPDGAALLDIHGHPLPPSAAPSICEDCGGFCAATATLCLPCWQRVRPRRPGGQRTNSPKHTRYLAHLLRSGQ